MSTAFCTVSWHTIFFTNTHKKELWWHDVWQTLWQGNKASISNIANTKRLKKHALHSVMWMLPQQNDNSWTNFPNSKYISYHCYLVKIETKDTVIYYPQQTRSFSMLFSFASTTWRLGYPALTYSSCTLLCSTGPQKCHVLGQWDGLINGWIKFTISNLIWWVWDLKR
jgi:hypothetical protein